MTSIQLNDQTAKEIVDAAQTMGVSVEVLLRTKVLGKLTPSKRADDSFDFDAELDKLVTPGPPLPADFSRADIYQDDDGC